MECCISILSEARDLQDQLIGLFVYIAHKDITAFPSRTPDATFLRDFSEGQSFYLD